MARLAPALRDVAFVLQQYSLDVEKIVGAAAERGDDLVALKALGDEIAAELTGAILKDLSLKAGHEVLLLVNGFGGTPLLELYLMVGAARKTLGAAGIKVVRYLTGSHVTSLEMAGCSITVSAADPATLALWEAPAHTAALRWGL